MPSGSSAYQSLQLERTSTVDRVGDELRRAIFDGEIAGGEPLREVALADSLHVSRSTVREALAGLVTEGLVTREPNRGVSVAEPAPESVRDVCRARLVLEGSGVRNWARAQEEERAAVRDRLREYADEVTRDGSYQDLNARHLAFHVSLVGLAGSPRLVAMAQSLASELRLALAQVERIRRNAHDQVQSHTVLVDLMEAGDIDAAYDELVEHLANAEISILSSLKLDA